MKNTLLQWILQNMLKNRMFCRIAKSISTKVDFYEMDFMKGNNILVKVDEMYYILKSPSHCLLVERLTWNWKIKVFAGVFA